MPRDIEKVEGLSPDARRLYDWMTAAFTGDVNEAFALARKHGTRLSKWTRSRLHEAHAELKDRGVLAADAPDLKEGPFRQHATKKVSALKHWKVKFTRRGMEPPRPFGKTSAVVCAASRKEALEMVPASPRFPITASITEDPVSFTYRCHHEAHSGDEPSSPKTKRELDADIAEVLDKPYPS